MKAMAKKNTRSLDAIASDINRLGRNKIIEIGELLIEARAHLENGLGWLEWLDAQFFASVDTAERWVRVAEFCSRFRTVRNLDLSPTTLYFLADYDDEETLPAIINELAKHATKKHLRKRDAQRVINIGIGRHRFGNYPDATLVKLLDLAHCTFPWVEKAIAALKEQKLENDEAANLIVDQIKQEYLKAERKANQAAVSQQLRDREEAENILGGVPPELPPPITPPEPHKLGGGTDWAETEQFKCAVQNLLVLRAKPVERLVGQFDPALLREVAQFLMDVAAADEAMSV
jgi:hypothetical protein